MYMRIIFYLRAVDLELHYCPEFKLLDVALTICVKLVGNLLYFFMMDLF